VACVGEDSLGCDFVPVGAAGAFWLRVGPACARLASGTVSSLVSGFDGGLCSSIWVLMTYKGSPCECWQAGRKLFLFARPSLTCGPGNDR